VARQTVWRGAQAPLEVELEQLVGLEAGRRGLQPPFGEELGHGRLAPDGGQERQADPELVEQPSAGLGQVGAQALELVPGHHGRPGWHSEASAR